MYIPQLTFTRFLAAVSIVIIHFGLSTWPFDSAWLQPVFTKALAAVSFFFVLSGFILVVSASKNAQLPESIHSKTFWLNRCARILPLYLFALTVYFLYHFDYNPDIPLKWQIQSFVYSVFLLQAWDYHMVMDINYPAWTISVEALFYLIFPWLYVTLKRHSSRQLVLTVLVAWIANTYLLKELLEEQAPLSLAFYYPPFHVATFLSGVASGILFVRHYPYLLQKAAWIRVCTVLLAGFTLYSIFAEYAWWGYYQNGFLSPLFLLIIFSLSLLQGKAARLLSAPALVFLGDISYAVYLLQVPVKEYLERYIPYFSENDFKTVFYDYLLILLLVSALTYWFLEKPMRGLIRKWVTGNSLPVVSRSLN